MSRHSMSNSTSRGYFKKYAIRQKKMNSAPPTMRGGIRL